MAVRALVLSDAEEEVLKWIFSQTPPLLAEFLTEDTLFRVGLSLANLKSELLFIIFFSSSFFAFFTDFICHAEMDPKDAKALHRAMKRNKTSAALTPKRSHIEAVLAQLVAGGSSRLSETPRRESLAPARAVVPL